MPHVTNIAWARDAAERAIATYIEAFLGLLIASSVIDISALKAAALGAIPAALSVLKSVVAKRIPSTVSPASVVAPQ